jgi:PPM family protein phosphatase
MSDQTARETPTEAPGGDGLPSATSQATEPQVSGSAGMAAPGEPDHAGASGEAGEAGSVEPNKPVNRKAPPPKARPTTTSVRNQKAGATGKPAVAAKPDKGADSGKKMPPLPKTSVAGSAAYEESPAAGAATSKANAGSKAPNHLAKPEPTAAAQAKPLSAEDPGARHAPAREPAAHAPAIGKQPGVSEASAKEPSPREAPARQRSDRDPAISVEEIPANEHPSEEQPFEAEPPAGMAAEQVAPQQAPGSEEPQHREVVIRLFGRTDVGQVREHNEDNFIVADLTQASRGQMEADRYQIIGDRGTLLGVCDGMGGAAAGEVASQLAVDIIYQRMSAGGPPRDHDELAARLVQAIEAAGLRIFSEAKLDRTRRGMGTTSTIAAFLDDHLFLGQVGDSRAYILRGDRLVQVTRDQSLVNQLIEAGQLTEEEAETFEHNNIILQALGTADTVQVDLTYVLLKKGDTLMLCSDGLSGMVRNEEIREVLRTIDDPLETCKVLTDRANQAGGHDNITVVVAKFDGEGLTHATREDIEGLRYQKYQLPEQLLVANAAATEPARRVKDLEEKKISQRPPAQRSWLTPPDAEMHDDGGGYAEDDAHAGHANDGLARAPVHGDDPIFIPTDGAPQWLVIMMIASAVACVTIAGYYLLR